MELEYFDTLLEPTFLVNQNLEILYLNESAAWLLGSTVKRILRSGKRWNEWFILSQPLDILNQLPSLAAPSGYQEVDFHVPDNPEMKRIQVSFQPFREMAGTYLVYTRDVTLEATLQAKYKKEWEQKEQYVKELEKAKHELDQYARLLEQKVEERTQELRRAYRDMKALMDNLKEGFFMVDSTGRVLPVVTRSCEALLEKDIRGLTFAEALGLDAVESQKVEKWLITVFQEMLPFEDLAPLGPSRYHHSGERFIELSYQALRDEDFEVIQSLIVVVSDKTEVVLAQQEAARQKAYSQLVLKVVQNPKSFALFMKEAKDWLEQLRALANRPEKEYDPLFRALHSLKGGAAQFSLYQLAEICHKAEGLLQAWQSNSTEAGVDLSHLVCEIEQVFVQQQDELKSLGLLERLEFDDRKKTLSEYRLLEFAEQLRPWPALYGSFCNQFIYEPIGEYLQSLNEAWVEVAKKLSKQVLPIKIHGAYTKIWPSAYENVLAQLVHIVRNMADHGIESPEERKQSNKPPQGRVEIVVERSDSDLLLSLSDDGRGVDLDGVRTKWAKMGVDTASWTEEQLLDSLFSPGFSTKDQATEWSGRGVGLDAVKEAIVQLGGHIKIDTQRGQGTRFSIRLPWIEPHPAWLQNKKSA